jgi:hypothetical protein
LILALLTATIGLILPVASAHAAPRWSDGPIQKWTCATTNDVAAQTGYVVDDATGPPTVGQVYFIHVMVRMEGSGCASPGVNIKFSLPPATQPAIDGGHHIGCFYGNSDLSATGCPPALRAWPGDPSAYEVDDLGSPDGDAWWPLPASTTLEIDVPVVTTTALTAADLHAELSIRHDGDQAFVGYPFASVPVTVVNAVPSPAPPAAPPSVPPADPGVKGGFWPVAPTRVLDTRSASPAAAGGVIALHIAGDHGVPADATAAVLNVTATQPTDPGYLTVYPCGTPPPLASNVNYVAGQTVPNLVVVKIGDGGNVCINSSATAHVVADLSGYHKDGGAGFVQVEPRRLLDTRKTAMALAGGSTIAVPVRGNGIGDDAIGAALNITVTQPTAAGYLTAYPCGTAPPQASNLNFVAGESVANLAMLGLGSNGSVCLFSMVTTDVVVDITGYFTKSAGFGFTGITPTRLLDTRPGARLKPNETRTIPLTGFPNTASGIVLNVTAADPTDPGYLTVFPCGSAVPEASSVNYRAGQTVPNLVAVGVSNGAVCIHSYASTEVIVDVTGFYGTGSYLPIPVTPGPADIDVPTPPPTSSHTPLGPNIISGHTYDHNGKPLAGVNVDIYLAFCNQNCFVEIQSGADGSYQFRLDDGIYQVYATYPNGPDPANSINLRMIGTDANAFPVPPGHVVDFQIP